jgi:predicted RNase H-like HicB family nuclease
MSTMNKNEILATAVCRWSEEDDGFVVSSDLATNIGAYGDTKEEAWDNYKMYLEDSYQAYLKGNFKPRKKRGRKTRDYGKAVSLRLFEDDIFFIRQEASQQNTTMSHVLGNIIKNYRNHGKP